MVELRHELIMSRGPKVKSRRFASRVKTALFVVALAALANVTNIQSQNRPAAMSIEVAAQPGAVIWVDDVRFGRTDESGKLIIRRISIGKHVVRVRADGFKEATRAVTGQGNISIPLTKTTDPAELAFQEAERLAAEDRDKAIDTYRKVIKLRPGYAAAYIALARALSEQGNSDAALKTIHDLRKFSPRNAEASAVEGRIYKDSGDETKAIAAFKKAITEGRGFQPEGNTGLGLLYKERAEGFAGSGNFADEDNNYNEAAKYLSTAIKQLSGAPDAVVVYQLLGLVYERQKHYDDAIRLYNEFLTLFPDSNDAPAVRSFIEQIKKQQAQPK